MGRLIELVEPVKHILPEVAAPPRGKRIPFDQKVLWTLGALLVYLICSQMPLYGITVAKNADPFYIMRMILASSRGTLMELGISPIITSGMIMQLLAGAKIIDVDMSSSGDRALFNSASKLLGILITVGEAVAYVLSGMYGDVRDLGAFTAILLIVQLTFAGIIVLTLDDVLSKGYGLGGGINLFIVCNICESIVWRCLSPTTYNIGKGTEFEGAIISTVHQLLTRGNKFAAVWDALFRDNLPNLMNLAATVIVFLVVIYIQGFKHELPLVRMNGPRGAGSTFPIKLFYTSNMPIILLSALVANLYFFSQVLFRRYPGNILIRLLGTWSEVEGSSNSKPVGGLAYYVSPPQSFTDVVMDPFHALFYIVFMLSACALFAKTWVEISGSGPHDIQRQFKAENVTIRGTEHSGSSLKRLKEIIPTAAAFGGMCVAALSIAADLMGAIGSGTGILMAVTLIYDLYEKIVKELKEEAKTPEGRSWLAGLLKYKSVV